MKKLTFEYAEERGYIKVWRAWIVNMLARGREVPENSGSLATLPQNDVELGKAIAYDVACDFLAWLVERNMPKLVANTARDHLVRTRVERDLWRGRAEQAERHLAEAQARLYRGCADCVYDVRSRNDDQCAGCCIWQALVDAGVEVPCREARGTE